MNHPSVIICLNDGPDGTAGTPIGWMKIVKLNQDEECHRHAKNFSIAIIPPFQGKGYAKEALTWLLDWAFLQANLRKISASYFAWNKAAHKLYENV